MGIKFYIGFVLIPLIYVGMAVRFVYMLIRYGRAEAVYDFVDYMCRFLEFWWLLFLLLVTELSSFVKKITAKKLHSHNLKWRRN